MSDNNLINLTAELTDRQRTTYQYLKDFIQDYGYAPTYPEIAQALNIKSTGVVHRYIKALEEQGLIELAPRRHRGIRLIDSDDSSTSIGIPLSYSPASAATLPLLGTIAAGQPIEAIPDQETVNFTEMFYGKDVYVLKVKGDSMIEAGIFDGDFVICERRDTAENGTIVVALIDNNETTLKRLQRNPDGTIMLIPANYTLQTQIYPAHRIRVQGVLIGQLRSYRR